MDFIPAPNLASQTPVPSGEIIQAAQNKSIAEHKMKMDQAANSQKWMEMAMQAVQMGSNMASQAVERAAKRQQMDIVKAKQAADDDFASTAANPPMPKTVAPSFRANEDIPVAAYDEATGTATPTGSASLMTPTLQQGGVRNPSTQDYSEYANDLTGKLFKAAPDEAAKAMLEQKFPKPQSGQAKWQQGTADVNGVPMLVSFNTADGLYYRMTKEGLQPIDSQMVRGFRPDTRTDPNTGELIRIGTGGGVSSVGSPGLPGKRDNITDPNELTVKQSTELKGLSQRFENDDIVKANRLTLSTLDNLRTAQSQGSGALIGALQSLRSRAIAGEKGVLTDRDVLRSTGSPQLTRRFSNAWNQMVNGKEDPTNLAEFNKALEAVQEAAAKRNQTVLGEFIKRAKNTKELNMVSDELIADQLGIGTEAFGQPNPTASGGIDAVANVLGLKKKGG